MCFCAHVEKAIKRLFRCLVSAEDTVITFGFFKPKRNKNQIIFVLKTQMDETLAQEKALS